MSNENRRVDDDMLTRKVKLVVWAVVQIGVTPVFCGVLLYIFNTTLKEQSYKMSSIETAVTTGLKDIKGVLEQQNRIMRHKSRSDDQASLPKGNG